MSLYTYVVRHDLGFAPNPYHGFCTLAICMTKVRKGAMEGDWVLGTGSARKGIRRGEYAVYAMRVTEILSFDQYWNDKRFRKKRPDIDGSDKEACGDNFYFRDQKSGKWRQIPAYHLNQMEKDTAVNRVLISNDFIYWGRSGPRVPEFCGVDIVHKKSGHSNKRFSPKVVKAFVHWIQAIQNSGDTGLRGKPLEL